MKKKMIFIMIFVLGIIIVSILLIFGNNIWGLNSENIQGVYDKEIKILNNNFPSDIIVYGEDVGFDDKLNFRTVSELSEDSLKSNSEYRYTFLVINDREGKLKITDEEFQLCKKMCEDHNLNFYYIGSQYLLHLKDFGFHDGLYADDSCGIGYVISPFGYATIQGIWTMTEEEYYLNSPELLGQILACSFVDDVIKMMN